MIGTIIWAIVAGTIIGALGRLMVPGRQNLSIWATIGVGIAAALIGGVLATWLGVGNTRGVDWIRHLIQVALAALFVGIAARAAANRPEARRAMR